MSQIHKCPKCGSNAMLYYEKNVVWICGKCKSLFSSYMAQIACDGASFHKLLLFLVCEKESLRDELIDTLPDPRVLISVETDDDEEEPKNKGLAPERRIIYQEVYHMLQAIHPANRNKIPQNILDFIDQARDRDFVPDFEISKGAEETKKISKDALALFSHLNIEYMCTPEEKAQLERVYEQNEVVFKKARKELLCRLVREADALDLTVQCEQLDQYAVVCAEVCCAMDDLPLDVTSVLFTDENLIELLRFRDYDAYSCMKKKLLVFNRMTERTEYRGIEATLQYLKALAKANGCATLL